MAKKITLSIPDDVYEKLEGDRGSIPRSTYIQDLIRSGIEDTEAHVHEESIEDSPVDTQDLPAPKVGFNPIPKSEQFKGVNKKGKMT